MRRALFGQHPQPLALLALVLSLVLVAKDCFHHLSNRDFGLRTRRHCSHLWSRLIASDDVPPASGAKRLPTLNARGFRRAVAALCA